MADLILAAFIFGPALLTYFLRSNGSIVFLSLCAGYTASILAGDDVASTLSSTSFKIRNTDIDLLFLFLPMAFSIFLSTGAIAGKVKVIMHAIASGLAGALFIVAGAPFLNISLHLDLNSTGLWPILSSGRSYLAAVGSLYALFLLWFFSKHHGKRHKH